MGPIGIVLEPSYDLHRYARLPYSCTHCGSCGDVCPVKVPIPDLVFYWRNVVVDHHEDEPLHHLQEDLASIVFATRGNLVATEKVGLWALRNLPDAILESPLNPWIKAHANPEAPDETFRQYFNRINPNSEEKQ